MDNDSIFRPLLNHQPNVFQLHRHHGPKNESPSLELSNNVLGGMEGGYLKSIILNIPNIWYILLFTATMLILGCDFVRSNSDRATGQQLLLACWGLRSMILFPPTSDRQHVYWPIAYWPVFNSPIESLLGC